MNNPFRIAVFASGRGSNFKAVLEAIEKGTLAQTRVVMLFSDKPNSKALEIARENDVDRLCLEPKSFANKADFERTISGKLIERRVDLTVLAGYMRIVGRELLSGREGKIINLHPSLLPRFPGKNSIQETHEANSTHAGVTVHYVDENVDTGPILARRAVPVAGDSLAAFEARIHAAEHELLPKVIEAIRTGTESELPK